MLNIFIGLFPALLWGCLPVILSKIGGKPIQQMIGTTFGAMIFATVVFFITYSQLQISMTLIVLCTASGLFWSVGQLNQYRAFEMIGVSKTMPLSTGLNLVSNSLFGVIIFGEWETVEKLLLGFLAIFLITLGVFFTSYQQHRNAKEDKKFKQGLIILFISTLGYIGYATLPNFLDNDGWSGFLPQVVGMVTGTLIHAIFEAKRESIFTRESWLNMISGFVFSFGALGYLISLQLNGVAIGYTLSQMGVVLSTIGGIIFLHEKKNRREMTFVIIGLVLICVGGVFIGSIK